MGEVYAKFLRVQLSNWLKTVSLFYCVYEWFQHAGAPSHYTQLVEKFWINSFQCDTACAGNESSRFLWGYAKNFVLIETPYCHFITITSQIIRNSKLFFLRQTRLYLQINRATLSTCSNYIFMLAFGSIVVCVRIIVII